jgi:hypothetical protein
MSTGIDMAGTKPRLWVTAFGIFEQADRGCRPSALSGCCLVDAVVGGVRKRAASALPTVDELVKGMRSDGTVEKAIVESVPRGVGVQ